MNRWMIFIFLLCVAGLSAPFMKSHDAQFYFERGSVSQAAVGSDHKWFHRLDLYSAQADFNHAIELDPKFVAAYSSRGAVKYTKGDLDGALKDYTSAIGLDPQNVSNYMARAVIELAKRDFEHALGDYEKAIELKPDNRAAYRSRAAIRETQNDFTGAVLERVRMVEGAGAPFMNSIPTNGESFTVRNPTGRYERLLMQLNRALENDPHFAWGYYYRGVLKSLTNDWAGALVDFQQCRNFPDTRLKDYAAIHTWLVQMQAGEKEKAEQGLLAHCQNRPEGTPGDWQIHIAKFLLGQIEEQDFSNAIDTSDAGREQSEFWYYAGMKHLLAGDKAGAADDFQKSLSTRTRPYAIYYSALAGLSQLNPGAAAE